jgi:hypothetical protein
VLGLDVIGNPYGLVVDITGGVQDFFYQPFQVKKLEMNHFYVFRERFKGQRNLSKALLSD